MSTTTIRLPDALEQRLASVAERAGTTPHAFILEAIADKTEQAERRQSFEDEADARLAKIAKGGETVSWAEARRWLLVRADGKRAARPAARKAR